MMPLSHCIVIFVLMTCGICQRSPYAGRRPIGYPLIEKTEAAAAVGTLGNKFGETQNITTTTQRLPIEALGDQELVNRLSKLPQDKQPFWLLNWQALEGHWKKPQSFEARPSFFADNLSIFQNPQNTQNPQQPSAINNNLNNQQDSSANNQGRPNTAQGTVLINQNGQNTQTSNRNGENFRQDDQNVQQNIQSNNPMDQNFQQNLMMDNQNTRPNNKTSRALDRNLRTNVLSNGMWQIYPTPMRRYPIASWTADEE